jgi:hypothetical protein
MSIQSVTSMGASVTFMGVYTSENGKLKHCYT